MAVSNINCKSFVFAPITLNRDVNRNQRVLNIDNLEGRITRIDREINARENLVQSNNRIISLRENIISNNEKLIAGGEKLLKLHQEQKENNNKIIEAAKTLLSRRGVDVSNIPSRSKSVQPSPTPKLPDLDEKTYKVSLLNTAFIADTKTEKEISNILPQGTLIKEQTAKLESDVKKHNMAIDFHDKQIAKLANSDKAKDVVSNSSTQSSSKNGLATSYKPVNPNHSYSFIEPENNSSSTKSYLSYVASLPTGQQKYIAQSQIQLWNSIVEANIRKLI